MQILAFVFLLIHPKIGILSLDVERHESREKRVARILRHRGEDGIVEILLDVEIIGKSFGKRAPLIVAEVVEHHPHHALSLLEFGEHGLAHHLGRKQGGVFGIGMLYPRFVVFANKLAERGVGFLLLRAQEFVHRRVGRFLELQFPVHELFIEFLPRFCILGIVHAERNAREILSIAHFGVLLSDFLCVDVLFERKENLHRIDRLQEIVGDLSTDGLIHQIFGFILRYHHHGHLWMQCLNSGEGFESRESRHILIEKDEVKGLRFAQIDCISTVVGSGDVVSSFFEEDAMRTKEVYFIVNPEKSCAHDGVHYVSTKLVQFVRLCKHFKSFDIANLASLPSDGGNSTQKMT